MIREICKDEAFLAQKAEPATTNDLGVALDLLDTLAAHKDGCVGMAANMIGTALSNQTTPSLPQRTSVFLTKTDVLRQTD